ncbi:MAG: hypothetical protein JHC74_09715 [Thermoleophilia bacterium]|jgi:hypothetical protein|nr:hypothetical protein [Thermoleophilia bacterium]
MSTATSRRRGLSESLAERHLTLARALILVAAFASFVLSVSLWFSGSEQAGIFVGVWVPSIISLGAFLMPRQVGR